MTDKQKANYNRMLKALRTIARDYISINELPKYARDTGLPPSECLEMIYDNVQAEARAACAKLKPIP